MIGFVCVHRKNKRKILTDFGKFFGHRELLMTAAPSGLVGCPLLGDPLAARVLDLASKAGLGRLRGPKVIHPLSLQTRCCDVAGPEVLYRLWLRTIHQDPESLE